jgi:5-methylcytosine-specific restriction endonuclease McrA
MVAEINKVATVELDLHRHLFGSDRVIPPRALRDGIVAVQDGQCFYCGGTLGAVPEADHFIPRIRCGIDAIENLVLTGRRCNNDKRDLLPGLPHVTAWARRSQRHGTALTSLATAKGWATDAAATMAVARSIYSHLPPGGTPLWLGFKDVGNADPAAALAALA